MEVPADDKGVLVRVGVVQPGRALGFRDVFLNVRFMCRGVRDSQLYGTRMAWLDSGLATRSSQLRWLMAGALEGTGWAMMGRRRWPHASCHLSPT